MAIRPRGKAWQVDVQMGTDRVRITCSTRRAAKQREAELLAVRQNRRAAALIMRASGAAATGVTFAELRRRFIADREASGLTPTTLRFYRTLLANFEEVTGTGTAADLSAESASLYKQRRSANGVSDRRINHGLTVLRTMVTWACDQQLLAFDPLPKRGLKIRNPKASFVRRSLSTQELELLIQHSKPEHGRLWRFFAATGLRSGQLCGLTWSMVDVPHQRLVLPASLCMKHHAGVELPLFDEARAVLDERRKDRGWRDFPTNGDTRGPENVFITQATTAYSTDLVRDKFSQAVGNVNRAAENAEDQGDNGKPVPLGIERRRIGAEGTEERVDVHSLRVYYCTRLAEQSVPLKLAMAWMQHTDPQLTMAVYAKVRPEAVLSWGEGQLSFLPNAGEPTALVDRSSA